MTLRPLSASQKDWLEKASRECEANVAGASGYLAERGLAPCIETHRLGLVPSNPETENLIQYAGRLAIPYIGPEGRVYEIAFRALGDQDAKYLNTNGMQKRLFNLQALVKADDVISITEGQLDALSLEVAGLHAVGVPGVSNWRPHHSRLFAGFSEVLVWADNDTPGRDFANRLTREMPQARVIMTQLEDVNALLVSEGVEGIHYACGGIGPGAADNPYPF